MMGDETLLSSWSLDKKRVIPCDDGINIISRFKSFVIMWALRLRKRANQSRCTQHPNKASLLRPTPAFSIYYINPPRRIALQLTYFKGQTSSLSVRSLFKSETTVVVVEKINATPSRRFFRSSSFVRYPPLSSSWMTTMRLPQPPRPIPRQFLLGEVLVAARNHQKALLWPLRWWVVSSQSRKQWQSDYYNKLLLVVVMGQRARQWAFFYNART